MNELNCIAMKTLCLLITAITFSFYLHAQNSRIRFAIGPEFSLPTYHEFPSSGMGGSAGVEFKSRNKFSANIEVGYNYFRGTVINEFNPDTIRGFAFIPVLGGLKYSLNEKFYASVRVGGIYGTFKSFMAYTFSPAAGIMLPNKNNPRVDLGARWIGVLPMPAILENTFIEKGGFSYLNIRAAIVF